MKKILTLITLCLLLAGSDYCTAQNGTGRGKKQESPVIEGKQKVRESDYDTVDKFTNFSTKSATIYYSPFNYANIPSLTSYPNPDWGRLRPVVNYLQKVTRATMTMCAIYAINPEIEDNTQRGELAEQARKEALDAMEAFEAWKVKKGMRNKTQYKVAEVDYRYFKESFYDPSSVSDGVIHVGVLMYFSSKKKPIFTVDTVSRVFTDIKFFPNDATIVESWQSYIDELADYLKENDRKGVLLTGYADNQGTEAYCIGLSRQRAMEVKKALQMRGIEANRIEIEAKGDQDPIGDNDTREGRIQNNRVSIKIQ